ncbi:hypothetical protein V7068_19005 [Bacillus sp. JJ634]
MLQQTVNGLNSGILDIKGDKVYVTGFTREAMLQSHLERGIQNFCLKGLHDNVEDLKFHEIKNDALIIVRKDGKEIARYQYKQVHKDVVSFKNEEGKKVSRTFIIRQGVYSEQYQFYFVTEEEDQAKYSELFDNKEELEQFLLENYGVHYSF